VVLTEVLLKKEIGLKTPVFFLWKNIDVFGFSQKFTEKTHEFHRTL